MSEDERRQVRDAFIAHLNTARRIAGSPSYRDIEIQSKRLQSHVIANGLKVTMLAASTVHRTLHGPGRDLPKWRTVAVLVFVLRSIADDNGVAPRRVGTIADWKARHEAAHAAMYDAAPPEQVAPEDDDLAGSISDATDLLCRDAATDRDLERMRALARQTMRLDWWWQYRDVVPRSFRNYLSLEPGSCLIRAYESCVIPNLLQSPAYAEADIRRNRPHLRTPEVHRRQGLRLWRQQILYRAEPVRLWAIIEETVLRRSFGTEVMRAQITHLINLCKLPNVSVQVVASGRYIATGEPLTLLRFPQREFSDVIHVEQVTGSLYPRTCDHYERLFNLLAIEARSPAGSIEALHRIREQT